MSKCSGKIGYVRTEETQPGVWEEIPEEKPYTGDVIRDNRRFNNSQSTPNDNLVISNNISIVSNKFMLDNLAFIKYITFMNSKWKISSVEVSYPRILITLGGLYNG